MTRFVGHLALSGLLVFLAGTVELRNWEESSRGLDAEAAQPQMELGPRGTRAHDEKRSHSTDSPMWGGTPSRNMVSAARNLPVDVHPGVLNEETGAVDLTEARNVRWVAELGKISAIAGACAPAVANGRVFIGTNNEAPRDPKNVGDRGVLLCLDEQTGELLWQLAVPKTPNTRTSDWEFAGINSTPAVEGDRLWLVTNRCEILCLDVDGLEDGNDGPFVDEADYMTDSWMKKTGAVPDFSQPYADIVWKFDMRKELAVYFHTVALGSPLVWGERLYAPTSNGVDWSHTNIPCPHAPALVALDKDSGELAGEEISSISKRTLHVNWSSPSLGWVGGANVLFFGGGDGFVYGFDPVPERDIEDPEYCILRELWRHDANPPEYRTTGGKPDGKPLKYASHGGPSEVIGSPVYHDGLVYVAIGQDAEHGDGLGMLSCLDPSARGDHFGRAVWTYKEIGRTMSTPSIADGLVFIAELDGDLHCLDAETGELQWVHSTGSLIMGSTLVADGKVHLGTENGELFIFEARREKTLLTAIKFPRPLYSTPVAANEALFIRTDSHLYALAASSKRP